MFPNLCSDTRLMSLYCMPWAKLDQDCPLINIIWLINLCVRVVFSAVVDLACQYESQHSSAIVYSSWPGLGPNSLSFRLSVGIEDLTWYPGLQDDSLTTCLTFIVSLPGGHVWLHTLLAIISTKLPYISLVTTGRYLMLSHSFIYSFICKCLLN